MSKTKSSRRCFFGVSCRQSWPAPWAKHVTLDFRVVSSSPTVGVEMTYGNQTKAKHQSRSFQKGIKEIKGSFVHLDVLKNLKKDVKELNCSVMQVRGMPAEGTGSFSVNSTARGSPAAHPSSQPAGRGGAGCRETTMDMLHCQELFGNLRHCEKLPFENKKTPKIP